MLLFAFFPNFHGTYQSCTVVLRHTRTFSLNIQRPFSREGRLIHFSSMFCFVFPIEGRNSFCILLFDQNEACPSFKIQNDFIFLMKTLTTREKAFLGDIVQFVAIPTGCLRSNEVREVLIIQPSDKISLFRATQRDEKVRMTFSSLSCTGLR